MSCEKYDVTTFNYMAINRVVNFMLAKALIYKVNPRTTSLKFTRMWKIFARYGSCPKAQLKGPKEVKRGKFKYYYLVGP